jgi:hypothetical protein
MMMRWIPGSVLVPLSAVVVLFGPSDDAAAQMPVIAGLDLLETNTENTFEDLTDLDLLCPGCFVIGDPIIPLRGIPLGESPVCSTGNLGNVDTIVRRLEDTPPLFPGENALIPIEIVELHLQSVEPFRVDCSGDIQNWMLDVTVRPGDQPLGLMEIFKTDPNGGFFNSDLPVVPHLIFTRVDDCPPTVVCEVDGPVINFNATGAPWVHHSPDPVLEIPGCTTNFVAGVALGPVPGLRSLNVGFSEAALLRAHGLLPPLPPKLEQHSWQDAVHFEFWLTNPGGKDAAPTIDALRMFNPRWIPMPTGPPDSSVYIKSNSICNLDSLWTPVPTSWCRVNWDSTSTLFRDEAWWFFPPVPVDSMAPEMDIVFSFPTDSCYSPPPPGAWYEVDVECYASAPSSTR